MRLLAIVLLTAVLALPLSIAQHSALQAVEGGVYVAWGFEGTPEDPPYSGHLLVQRGSTGCYSVGVWNTLSAPIRNVTLTIHPQRDAVRFGFEVMAGDDADLPYAFWAEVPANGTALACLHVFPGPGARSLDSLAVARFELDNGTEGVARWPKFGKVAPESRLPALALPAFILAAATATLLRKR